MHTIVLSSNQCSILLLGLYHSSLFVLYVDDINPVSKKFTLIFAVDTSNFIEDGNLPEVTKIFNDCGLLSLMS